MEFLKHAVYKVAFYYQKMQIILLSIFVVGLVDYFFLYEFLMSLAPLASVLALEAAPLVLTVLLIVAVRGIILYVRKKMRERKNYSLLW
ncbi:hypothetical protein E5161_00215 [Cohnella pontilimi]|uniref:Uncharacterized protein n=1 Tax=Cohnella pontilimi TaxID=2564100 RepID=A0A4U0FFX2_9BACL|nr:hypothetical protein [Cohnella pontilimi]TJY43873.1 hypothetical protein E5161_00215 [Cohnella pontilimi]